MSSGSSHNQLAYFNVLCRIGKVIHSLSPSRCFSEGQIQINGKICRTSQLMCLFLSMCKMFILIIPLYIPYSCPVVINSQELMVLQFFKLNAFMYTSFLYLQILSVKPCHNFFPCMVEEKLN